RHHDLTRHIEQHVPVRFQPGTAVSYSGPGYAVLSRALGEAMRGSEWTDLRSLLDKELMSPLDLHPQSWSIGYDDDLFRVDGLDLHATWGGAAFTLRATARIGQLLLQQGVWQKRQLLSDHVVKRAITFDGMTTTPNSIQTGQQPAPALGWWSNEFGALKSLPRDAFLAAGAGHRVLIVVPSLDLVIVRYGQRLGVDHWDGDFWQVLDEVLLAPVIHAIDDDHQSATCCQ
ncbi:MAG: serine hydrolase, partial [Pseudomonadota bacterium]